MIKVIRESGKNIWLVQCYSRLHSINWAILESKPTRKSSLELEIWNWWVWPEVARLQGLQQSGIEGAGVAGRRSRGRQARVRLPQKIPDLRLRCWIQRIQSAVHTCWVLRYRLCKLTLHSKTVYHNFDGIIKFKDAISFCQVVWWPRLLFVTDGRLAALASYLKLLDPWAIRSSHSMC